METRSSYVLVGSVVLAFTVLLFAAVLWLARFSGDTKQEFDILFSQSISGLAVGSAVAFNGVPAGKIDKISIVPESPELVRVRISVDPDIPVLRGTTAGIEGVGFTGVSQIQLTGAVGGQPPIEENGKWGRPIIPSRKGALGQLLASAPELLNNVSDLTASLNKVLNAQNRESIAHILVSTDRLANALADRGPEIAATLAETRLTMRAATEAAQALKTLVGDTDGLVNNQAKQLLTNLNVTVGKANDTLAKIDDLAGAAKPGIEALSTQTVPDIGQLIRDLRDVTTSLGAVSQKLDQDPAGALLGGRRLPDYNPGGGKKAK